MKNPNAWRLQYSADEGTIPEILTLPDLPSCRERPSLSLLSLPCFSRLRRGHGTGHLEGQPRNESPGGTFAEEEV